MSRGGSQTVCAVVVTFNRKAMLRECLHSILAQTRVPDHIVVVDNHSTDGTLALVEQEFVACHPSKVTALSLPENSGGAGGFAAGMDWAHKAGFDWIWVMDDDIEVVPDALESMLAHQDVSHFIHCRKVDPSGQTMPVDAYWDVAACVPLDRVSARPHQRREPWTVAQCGNFEGALIRSSIVDRIGLPDARFFVGGDDGTYGLVASYHTTVIYLDKVGIRRKLSLPQRPGRLGWHLLLRNRFLFREYLSKLNLRSRPDTFWFHQVWTLGWAVKHILADPQAKKWESLTAVTQGLIDGALGRFGRPPFLQP